MTGDAAFDDLVALGLRAALEADAGISVIARDLTPARLDSALRVHRPRVLILDVAILRDYAQVREIRLAHPDTCVVLLGDGLSTVESAQLLAFGASACLATGTQVRDLRHAIYLASRGLQLQALPQAPEARATEPLLTAREGDVLVLLRQNRSNAQIALFSSIGNESPSLEPADRDQISSRRSGPLTFFRWLRMSKRAGLRCLEVGRRWP